MFGDNVSVRKLKRRFSVKNYAKRDGAPKSAKEEAHRQKFLEGVQYAKQQTSIEESRLLYETGITAKKRTVHLVAMTDYLTPPRVHEVDAENYQGNIGDTIMIRATDDFMVTGVKIVIRSSDGKVLEKGNASPDEKLNHWKYLATIANPSVEGTTIQATAFDRPGNKTTLEKVL